MAKRLVWFEAGQDIPDNARYIKSEHKQTDTVLRYGPAGYEYEVKEFHLYEVPLDNQ